jgi:hypothetical protein
MRQTRRRGLSASQKQELWERWKRGQSRNDIARALAKNRGSIHYALACNGNALKPKGILGTPNPSPAVLIKQHWRLWPRNSPGPTVRT